VGVIDGSSLEETQMALTLSAIPMPGNKNCQVIAFGNWKDASKHIWNHVLSHPEQLAWQVVVPELADAVDQSSIPELLRQTDSTAGQCLLRIYDLYIAEVGRESLRATRVMWVVRSRRSRVVLAIGLSGVLLVVGTGLITALIPGRGDAQIVRNERLGFDRQVIWGRNQGMRQGGSRHLSQGSSRERRDQQERQAKWSRWQHLYYEVFRPAVQFVRSYSATQGGQFVGEYGLLKDVLRGMADLRYENWMQMMESGGEAQQ
jgi:hypothetical protein